MKRLNILPIIVFVIGISTALISNAGVQQTAWVYESNGQQVSEPDCLISEEVCAREFNLNPNGSLGAPTGEIMHGTALTD